MNRDVEGLVVWFRRIVVRERDDEGNIEREVVKPWHVQKTLNVFSGQPIAACGYDPRGDPIDRKTLADPGAYDDVCKRCEAAVAREEANA